MRSVRIWHLALLVVFVAIAIANIQDQHRQEPFLVGLAAIGFVVYGVLCWSAWILMRRYQKRLGRVTRISLYLVGVGVLFLAATWTYLVIEGLYLK